MVSISVFSFLLINFFAMPKSIILIRFVLELTIILSGFISRWLTPFSCKYSKVLKSYSKIHLILWIVKNVRFTEWDEADLLDVIPNFRSLHITSPNMPNVFKGPNTRLCTLQYLDDQASACLWNSFLKGGHVHRQTSSICMHKFFIFSNASIHEHNHWILNLFSWKADTFDEKYLQGPV